ncbi:MAG: MarR family transcriptional regulator [Sphingobium sp.]|nr:MarR family transcriptional regulator [Sphingobium sp.]
MARTEKFRTGKERKGFQKPSDVELGFLGDHIGFQVHIARRALRQAMRDFRPTGLPQPTETPPPSGTMSSLVLIGLNPGISQQEIAACLFLDPSKAALLIKNLERADLIEKRQAITDKRKFELHLTELGQEKLPQIDALSSAQERRIGRGLTARERGQLLALLIKMQDTLR